MTNQSASLSTDSDDIARTCCSCAGDGESIPVSQRASQLAMEWFGHPAHNDVETFLARLPITIGSKPIDDPYAEWHPNTTDFGAMSRAHLLRIYHGWKHETALHGYLADEPQLVSEIGFDSLPGQSALYKAWHKRFSEEYRDELTETVETVIEIARDNGVNVPDHAFRPEEKQDEELSARAQRRHACRTAKDVWQAAKPLVGPVVDFDRPDDTEIHDNAFIEMHTFLGCRTDLYAETGAVDFFEETTRERTPTGSYHRNCIRSVEVEQHRENHRRAMKNVIARAKQAGDFSEPAITAIDITEGDLFQGERNTKKLKEQIIGTKENNREVAYQYATIQVVGNDLPIVLDSIPVTKGMPRAMIVHELLRYSTDMLQIDLVLMDREFDGEAVKDACDHNTMRSQYLTKRVR
jgi:putative transposase